MSEKLIRDKILARIQQEKLGKGERPIRFRQVSGAEKQDFLLKKLTEEVGEFVDAKNTEEAGDVFTVLDAIAASGHFDQQEIEWRRGEKVRRDWIPDFTTLEKKVDEFKNSQNETNLGDIFWIMERLLDQLGVDLQRVEEVRLDKQNKSGVFEEGIVVDTEDL